MEAAIAVMPTRPFAIAAAGGLHGAEVRRAYASMPMGIAEALTLSRLGRETALEPDTTVPWLASVERPRAPG